MYELINNVPLKVKEYKGQNVLTFKDIDMVHGRPEGTARKRFNDNREHFIEGEDFFFVKSADIQKSEFRTFGFEVPNRGIILITENGYLMLVKSFTDELSWSVQRQLVKVYFRAREMSNSYTEVIEMYNTINTNIESINKRLDTLECKIDTLEQKIDTLEYKTDTLECKVDILEYKIYTLEKNSSVRTNTIIENIEKSIIDTSYETIQGLTPCLRHFHDIIKKVCNTPKNKKRNLK
ncbi:MAG: ORF6N domain-containing protein [Ruminococcus flavefaciens]|nr:ORF6N domain-containing protein [Ruminococcus flavefaciens]